MEIGIPWFVKPGIYRLETKMCLIVWLEWCGGSPDMKNKPLVQQ
jgi:hypothetical protein